MRCCLLSVTLMAAMVGSSLAQGPAGAPPPSNVVKQQRPYYVEGAVVVVLMAAATFAVCRSSRRS